MAESWFHGANGMSFIFGVIDVHEKQKQCKEYLANYSDLIVAIA